MNKKIANIVFYKFWDPTREEAMQQACVFYEDGTVKNMLYEEGKELANEIAKEEKVKTKAEFAKMINTTRVYALTGEEFEKRFKEFLGKGTALAKASDLTPAIVTTESTTRKKPKPANPTPNPTGSCVRTPGPTPSTVVPPVGATPSPTKTTPKPTVVTPTATKNTPKPTVATPKPTVVTPSPTMVTPTPKSTEKPKKEKKKGLFGKLWVKVTAFVLAAAMFFTGGYHIGKHAKCKPSTNKPSQSQSQTVVEPQDQAFLNLLSKSTNADQKATMKHIADSLDLFNKDFAGKYIENGKNVKASLTWDEMVALNLAYNTYSKEQIRIIFNGAEADATALSNAYRNANLQLMGAYVISDRQAPVNSASFLVKPEEKAFVEKYSDLFYKMKETTGAEQVAAIQAFYNELYKDFPIAEDVREEGISHAEGRAQIAKYKAAVTPMVMAAEIMFQNTSGVDHTLSDKAIKYFNGLGLCNLIDEEFERVETITLTSTKDENQPSYTEFEKAKVDELIYEDNYPISDEERDLSQLTAFQKWVNGRFQIVNGINTGVIIPGSAIVTGNRAEAVQQAGESAVSKAEDAVAAEINKQNNAAQQQAQAEADKNSAAAKAEVAEDQSDMQNQIGNANNTINNGGTVNEDDFGNHDVDFDSEHEDGNGNLNDSVTDITTDGTGAKTEEDLPDPNQTGAVFDGNATSIPGTPTETEPVDNAGIIEYEEPYYRSASMTNEQIVDAYIASLEGKGAPENPKVYQK